MKFSKFSQFSRYSHLELPLRTLLGMGLLAHGILNDRPTSGLLGVLLLLTAALGLSPFAHSKPTRNSK